MAGLVDDVDPARGRSLRVWKGKEMPGWVSIMLISKLEFQQVVFDVMLCLGKALICKRKRSVWLGSSREMMTGVSDEVLVEVWSVLLGWFEGR